MGLGLCLASAAFELLSALALLDRRRSAKPGIPSFRHLLVNPRKLEHGFRMIHAGIPYTLL